MTTPGSPTGCPRTGRTAEAREAVRRRRIAGDSRSGQGRVPEHLANAAELPHPRLAVAAQPPVHGLQRNAEPPGSRLLRHLFPTQDVAQPVPESDSIGFAPYDHLDVAREDADHQLERFRGDPRRMARGVRRLGQDAAEALLHQLANLLDRQRGGGKDARTHPLGDREFALVGAHRDHLLVATLPRGTWGQTVPPAFTCIVRPSGEWGCSPLSCAGMSRAAWDPWWLAARLTAGSLFHAAFRLRVEGVAKIPARGGAL